MGWGTHPILSADLGGGTYPFYLGTLWGEGVWTTHFICGGYLPILSSDFLGGVGRVPTHFIWDPFWGGPNYLGGGDLFYIYIYIYIKLLVLSRHYFPR